MSIVRSARWHLKVARASFRENREAKLASGQLAGGLLAVIGIAGWSWQAALLVAGIALITAIEVQP
jgi:hypothetical protein